MVGYVAALMATDRLRYAWMSYDATGVGRAVKDLLWGACNAGQMGDYPPLPVTITGAERPHRRHRAQAQPHRRGAVSLQQGLLKIADELPLGEVLERELTGYRMRMTNGGRDSYYIARKAGTGHGDLVIALALAARHANHSVPPPMEESAT